MYKLLYDIKLFSNLQATTMNTIKYNKLFSAIFALLLLGSCSSSEPSAQADQPPGTKVKLLEVKQAIVEESSEFVGSLEAQQRAILRAETDGRIIEIFAQPGDRVSAGEPIAQLRLDRSQAQVSSAIANVDVARSARERAQRELLAAEAERVSVAAELELQNSEFDRTTFLVSEGAQAQQQLDRVRRDRDRAVAILDAANKQVEAARATFEEANASLSQAKAEVDVVNENFEDTRIIAPVAGVVGDIPVKVGDYLSVGERLTVVTQNSIMELRFSVPLEAASNLQLELPVELRVGQENEPIVTGRISFISPRVNDNAQSVLAKARFPNPNGRLRDRQFVKAKVIWRQDRGVLIPTSSVSRIGTQAFVYVSQESEESQPGQPQLIARQQAVELGNIQGNNYQVIKGLEPGDNLIVTGILNLSDGTAIIPDES